MSMTSGVAAIFTTLDDSDPKVGKMTAGTSTKAAHGDHIHPLVIPFGYYVTSGYIEMEFSSSLYFVWTPNNNLIWDDSTDMLYAE